VTMGSKQYPLPIGRWKATTYAFLPPFNYQPKILNNPKTDKEWSFRRSERPRRRRLARPDEGALRHPRHQRAADHRPRESSGCIRMTNWDVLRLARMMKPGFTAIFQASLGSVETMLEALQGAGLEFIPAGEKSMGGGPGLRTRPVAEPEVAAAEAAVELDETGLTSSLSSSFDPGRRRRSRSQRTPIQRKAVVLGTSAAMQRLLVETRPPVR
jgi:hypothetical protein